MEEVYKEFARMDIATVSGPAIMKALEHSDLQMTMHYVSLGKSHIRDY